MLGDMNLLNFDELKQSLRKEVGEEIRPYLKRLDLIEMKIDRLIYILEPISKAIRKIPFFK
ncbi:hypothetical protein SCBWM1_gp159 [Synechococcus phage S-CBWM1]|uniref:Uncharacterized protein n=1 Tax=Synechococcus phage S-CBWM1 TaxID=2053653 RepID=A0A3G1L3T4_9CAUD|nr:hypothetical protein HOU61_gp038 [Synechococcus phage S-CBWM1]ATW62843.1 hypothetical protein SCBWM1_gp159 [Synechococcus phage S-CBWM1]